MIVVEGTTDVQFLLNLNNIPEFKSIYDIQEKCTIVPLGGGGTVTKWIQAGYLNKLNCNIIYFKDKDTNKIDPDDYIKENCITTKKREIENYIDPNKICQKFSITFEEAIINNWANADISKLIYNKINGKYKDACIKNILQSKEIWNEMCISEDDKKEIKQWFNQFKACFSKK